MGWLARCHMNHAKRQFLWLAVISALSGCSRRGSLGELAPALEAPSSVDFGSVYVGDSVTRKLVLRSVGSADVYVHAVRTSSLELVAAFADEVRLAPSESYILEVGWRPQAVGPQLGSVTIVTDPEQRQVLVTTVGEARALPDCDDGNPCTDEYFDKAQQACRYSFNTSSCDDGSACTSADTCHEGVCRGLAKSCNDDNPCTYDLCDPARGCIFPEGALHCDDGDPCTVNRCTKADGCVFPDADNGTPCGAFDCSTAHVCILGSCQSLDISGSSDGFPCSDGNSCTDGDFCSAGACSPGVPRDDPEVVYSWPTFGAPQGSAATDGYRFAFTTAAGLQLATQSEAGLVAAARVPVPNGASGYRQQPIVWTAGVFLSVSPAAVSWIDATDPTAPEIAWTRPLAVAELPPGADAVELLPYAARRAPGGLILSAEVRLFSAGTLGSTASGVYYVPIAPSPSDAPLFVAQLDEGVVPSAMLATDGDGGGDAVAWLRGEEVHWRRLSAAGQTVESVDFALPDVAPPAVGSEKIMVEGRRVLVHGQATWVIDIDGGDAQASPQPTLVGSVSNPATGVVDVALLGNRLYFASSSQGLWSVDLAAPAAPPLLVDPFNALHVERGGAGELVLSSSVGVQLLSANEDGSWRRITGAGHGRVLALSSTATGAILLGSAFGVARAQLAGFAPEITWSADPEEAGELTLLQGSDLGWLSREGMEAAPAAVGEQQGLFVVQQVNDSLSRSQVVLSAPNVRPFITAAAGDALWYWRWGADLSAELVRWPLLAGAVGKVAFDVPPGYTPSLLRAADRTGGPIMLQSDNGLASAIDLFDPTSGAVLASGSWSSDGGRAVTQDGTAVLITHAAHITLSSLGSAADVPAELDLPAAPAPAAWMADARAWLVQDATSTPALWQLDYGVSPPSLALSGALTLSQPPRRLHDTGDYLLVATDDEVLVIAPACRN